MTSKIAARYTTTLTNLTGRDQERGATALEYVGMIVVAAIVVGFIVAGMRGAGITGAVTNLVNQILGGGRASG